ncbi:MAG: hypothetical protein J6B09_03615 [Clostridia bacterium]|nr:hypothetical protein [Clostridia bacterium]MBQ8717226.1 hypothetical protein [Clostridia bacterium]
MDRAQAYEKIYFNDNYKEQFEALRNRYHTRTQEALQGRKVDHAPVPNATTIVYLNDNGDGDVYVTTGDFVEYFNRRFGGSDRIGAMRRSLSGAVRKAELCRESKKDRRASASETHRERRSFQPLRSVRSGFSFLHAVLAMVLILSIGILGGTSLLLERAEAEVMALEEEVAILEATHGTLMVDQYNATAIEDQASYPDMSGGDSVEIYPAVKGGGVEMASLLNALASLGK